MINPASAVLAAVLFYAFSVPANALNARTWVSGKGVDQAGCGPIANPCRTLQYAHDNTSEGGEVDVLDSAGYGSLRIGKSISIVSDGALAGVLAPADGGAAIQVWTLGATNNVTLRGLTIEGAGKGYAGIALYNGSVTISRCVIQNFAGDGIYINPAYYLAVNLVLEDSDISFNTGNGVYMTRGNGAGADTITVLNSRIKRNASGLLLTGNYGGAQVRISNTAILDNTDTGLQIKWFNLANVDGVTIHGHKTGITSWVDTFLIGRSTIIGNTKGLVLTSGLSLSYRNNEINANGTDVTGTLQTAPLQ